MCPDLQSGHENLFSNLCVFGYSFLFSKVHFQRTHSNLPISDSPYGDVSGLPDPYTGHDISDELRQQSLDMHGLEHDLSATAPEGYTTPNRRVIREIIV